MKTDYSKLPADRSYDVFRNSEFSKVIDDKLSSLAIKGKGKCTIVFRPVTDNPEAVSFSCFDLNADTVCAGTPDVGKFLLTKRAYEDFRGNRSNSDNVKRDLKRIDEFLYAVKVGTRRDGIN